MNTDEGKHNSFFARRISCFVNNRTVAVKWPVLESGGCVGDYTYLYLFVRSANKLVRVIFNTDVCVSGL